MDDMRRTAGIVASCFKRDRRKRLVAGYAVVNHDHIAGNGHLEVRSAHAPGRVAHTVAGPACGVGRRIHQIVICACGFGALMVRLGVELIRGVGLREGCRQVGAAIEVAIGFIGFVDQDLVGGKSAAVDPHVFYIAGKVCVAFVVAGAPLVPDVPAGAADVVILIGADFAKEIVQIPGAAFFGVGCAVLHAVDPVGDRAACDPDHHVVDLAGCKGGRARGRGLDMFGAVCVNVAYHRR